MILLRRPEVIARVGLCARTIDDLEAKGLFPGRVKLNPANGRACAWSDVEVDDWIKARLAEREAA